MAHSIARPGESRSDSQADRFDLRDELISLLIFGIALPVVVTWVNYHALRYGTESVWTTNVLLPVYALYIFEVAFVGYAIGKGLRNPMMKWIVFVWAMMLIDLQMFVAVALTARHSYMPWSTAHEMPYALFAGQLGMLTIWGVLGGTPALRRLPLVAIALVVTVHTGFASNGLSERSTLLLFAQCVATIALCTLIWIRGFRIERTWVGSGPRGIGLGERFQFLIRRKVDESAASVVQNTLPQGGRMQFSLWHVFLWVSGLAPLLAIARVLDWAIFQNADVLRIFELIGTSIGLAIVSVVALWAALGKERSWVRLGMLSLLAPVIGCIFGGLEAWTAWTEIGRSWRSRRANWGEFAEFSGERILFWIVWTVLSSFFLAGMLLIFRASGYGLFRRTPVAAPADSET